MLHQPNLFSSDPPTGSAEPALKAATTPQQGPPLWLRRLELGMRVFVRLYLGTFLLVLPWWPRFWDDNPLFAFLPHLGEFASYGAVRGVVSGLGLLNLWVALSEAVHYREQRHD